MTIPEQTYVFRGVVTRVVDGDTLDIDLDVGLHCHRLERLRLLRVNAPEMRGETKAAGEAALKFVRDWVYSATAITVQTYKGDAFGRYLAEVWRHDGANLSDDLLANGHAVPYP